MEEIFGNDELFNHTLKLGASKLAHVYTAEEIKSSSCWGFKCKQQVDEVCIVPQPIHQESEV